MLQTVPVWTGTDQTEDTQHEQMQRFLGCVGPANPLVCTHAAGADERLPTSPAGGVTSVQLQGARVSEFPRTLDAAEAVRRPVSDEAGAKD